MCPLEYSEILLGMACQRNCPAGMKECKAPLGETYCATSAPLLGADSCDVLGKLWLHLDKDTPCKYPAVNPKPYTRDQARTATTKPAATPKKG